MSIEDTSQTALGEYSESDDDLGNTPNEGEETTHTGDSASAESETGNNPLSRAAAIQVSSSQSTGGEAQQPPQPSIPDAQTDTETWAAHPDRHCLNELATRLGSRIEIWSPSPDRFELPDLSIGSHPETTPTSSDSSRREGGLQAISRHARQASNDSFEELEANEPADATKAKKDHNRTTAIESHIVENECPECGGHVSMDNDEQFCQGCGLVIVDETVDSGPEWRAFTNKDTQNRKRVGSPVSASMHDKGLSTQIGSTNKDGYGNTLSAKKQSKMKRLKKWDSRFKVGDAKERNEKQAFSEIKRICGEMDLPDYVTETASTIYRKAHDDDLLPGRSLEAVASASIYIAMRQAKIPKTVKQITDYSRVGREKITRARTYLERELGIEIEPPQVEEYLTSVGSELDISSETEQQARDLIDSAVQQNVHSGKAPAGLAASAIYAATMVTQEDRVTQDAASDAGEVCELTIRTRYRDVLEAAGFDPEELSPPAQSDVGDDS